MRTARARNWCVTTFGLSALLALAEDVLSIEARSGSSVAAQ
jgi:hypothetical protein